MKTIILTASILCGASFATTAHCMQATIKVRQQFQAYQAQKDSLSVDAKLHEIEQIIRSDQSFAEAFAERARVLASTGQMHDRIAAIKSIERAILLQPDNPEFHFTAGTIHLQRDQYSHRTSLAKNAFEQALALRPNFGKASYQLGLLAENAYLEERYLTAPHEDWTISFSQFAEAHATEATRHFSEAARHLEVPAPAYFRLALLSFENRDYKEMRAWLQNALAHDSTASISWLFAAYANYALGDFEPANSCFDKARHFMTDSMRTTLAAVAMIVTPAEAAKLSDMSASEREQRIRQHWQKSDPLFLTELNERRIEHAFRFAYANLRYNSPRTNIAGYQTDPGKTIMRYGFPSKVNGTTAALEVEAPLLNTGVTFASGHFSNSGTRSRQSSAKAGTRLQPGRLTWSYDNFEIPFDRKMSGRDEFAWGVENSDGRDIYNRLIQKTPERFEPMLPGTPAPLNLTINCFRSENDQTEVFVFAGFREDSSSPKKTTHSGERGFFIFDTLYQPISQIARHTEIYLAGSRALSMHTVILPSGLYEYSMEIVDRTSQRIGVERNRFEATDFTKNELQLSDIVLATAIAMESGETKGFHLKGHNVQPSINRTFSSGSQMHVLFEIYDLAMREGESRYRLEMSLSNGETERTAVSYEFRGSHVDALHTERIDLSSMQVGVWQLTVRVMDLIAGQEVRRQGELIVK